MYDSLLVISLSRLEVPENALPLLFILLLLLRSEERGLRFYTAILFLEAKEPVIVRTTRIGD